jgi:hypothetical protein
MIRNFLSAYRLCFFITCVSHITDTGYLPVYDVIKACAIYALVLFLLCRLYLLLLPAVPYDPGEQGVPLHSEAPAKRRKGGPHESHPLSPPPSHLLGSSHLRVRFISEHRNFLRDLRCILRLQRRERKKVR